MIFNLVCDMYTIRINFKSVHHVEFYYHTNVQFDNNSDCEFH